MKNLFLWLKLSLIVLTIATSSLCLSAQTCLPANIRITTQSQIDNFISNYGTCDTVSGILEILGTDITNLTGLVNIRHVGEYLQIDGTRLENVNGLENLQSIGDQFFITRNAELGNVNALGSLESVGAAPGANGRVLIRDNPKLGVCCGLLRLFDNIDDGTPGPGPGTNTGIPDIKGNLFLINNLPSCNSFITIRNGGACPEPPPAPPIPTMSQWAMLLFGLIVVTLGVVGVWNIQRVNSRL